MIEMILGFMLGAMVFTETGRDIGNKMADVATTQLKKMQEADHDNKR